MLFTHSEENCSNSLTFPRAVGSCWSLHMCIHMSALWTLPILFSPLSFFFCLWTVSTNFSFTTPLIALWCSQAWNTKKHQINLVLLCQLMQKHKSTNSVWFGVFYVCLALLVQSWLNCFTDRGGPSLFLLLCLLQVEAQCSLFSLRGCEGISVAIKLIQSYTIKLYPQQKMYKHVFSHICGFGR